MLIAHSTATTPPLFPSSYSSLDAAYLKIPETHSVFEALNEDSPYDHFNLEVVAALSGRS